MKKIYGSLAVLALLSSSVQAVDYKVGGSVELFSKAGFNNQAINEAQNIYPTDSFMSVAGNFKIDANFLSQEEVDQGQRLTGSIGALAGGILADATRTATGGSQIKGNYIDANFVLHTLALDYVARSDEHSFAIKAGRYGSSAQFMSGNTQGFDLTYSYKGFKAWWFSSYGRGIVGSQWIFDFSPRMTYDTLGANGTVTRGPNYGIHAFKPSYTFENGLYISPFVYFSPGSYVAPMLEVSFDSNSAFKGEGFRSTTRVIVMAPFHDSSKHKIYQYQELSGEGGQTLSLKQQFDYDNYNFGLGWYQNFGNANAWIGTYGNAAIGGWDFWTGSVYDLAGALSNVITKNAKTGYVFVGGNHGSFAWNALGRLTFSPRGDERAALVAINYALSQNIKLWLKVEYQNVTTHAGYVINNSRWVAKDSSGKWGGKEALKKDRSDDRSHAMMTLTYAF